jgi:type IV pilus assembly protein PilY1
MKRMKKAIALAMSVSFLFVGVPPFSQVPAVRADDSEIFGANIQPNVMILIDSSQSMDDYISQAAEAPYSAATVYTGSRATAKVYSCTSGDCATDPSRYSVYKNTIADVPCDTARTALSTVGKWNGNIRSTGCGGSSYRQLRTGNYLNYLFSPIGGVERKITVAKRVLANLLSVTEGVRFGTMKFTTGGGQVMSPIGTSTATLISGINSMSLTSVGTVLGEQLRDASLYYSGDFGYATPIQLECQPNFVIVLSDGLYTGIRPRDQATALSHTDHSNTLPNNPDIQKVMVHTIGFALPPEDRDAANPELQATADNGGGQFFSTESEAQLEAALEEAIRRIVAATFSFATPVIPTTSATGSNRAYLAAFQSDPSRPAWSGYLKAYNRDSTGNVPVDPDTGVPLDSAKAWDAAVQLTAKAASTRTIKTATSIGGALQDFATSNTDLTAAVLDVPSADRDKLINYVRGIDAFDIDDRDSNVTEERTWKLGDIFHSTPALVTPPRLPSSDSGAGSYTQFRTTNSGRTTILIGGANDGMLHAFRESDGEELWAFIPPDLLENLKTLVNSAADHPFYVDGSPIVADVKTGGAWKTIVVFGERRGGKYYHALDITNTESPTYLWSFTDAKMGETWSEPVIGKVKMNPSTGSTEKYVAIVGGGYDTANNNTLGKAVFAIDLSNGTKLWEYSNPGSASDDRQYMNFSIPANPAAADLSRDGFIDRVYIGDLGGQLWKFDFSTPATLSSGLVDNWTGKRIFAAPGNPAGSGEYYPTQAIYVPPALAYDTQQNLWIYFGTGDRNHPTNSTAPNRFYGIKDNVGMTNGSVLTESNLANVTSDNATVTQGWYFLLGTNEKVLASADVFNKIVFFTTFTPTGSAACGSGGGAAKLYAVQMTSGYAAMDWTSGTALTTSNATLARAKTIGTGIPSRPIIVITESGATLTTSVIAATTSQQLPSNPAPPPNSMRQILYWREVY